MFRECGWPSFVVLLFAIAAVVLGLVALALAIAKPRWGLILAVLALAASCSTPGAGAAGTAWGKQQVEAAVSGASIEPGQRQRIREVGYAEAAQCTTFGVIVGALPILMSLGALLISLARRGKVQAQ